MMKKLLALLTILTLVFGLAACMGSGSTQTTPPQTDPSAEATTLPTTVPTTVPDPMADSLLRSMDLTGKTLEEAAQALTDAVASYKLSLTVNGSKATLAAGDIMVAVDQQALAQYMTAVETGADIPSAVVTCDRAALITLLGEQLNTEAKNAAISYDSDKKQFAAVDGENGMTFDLDAAADAAAEAIGLLISTAEAEVAATTVAPEITADSETVKNALSTANGYLKVSLKYTYSPEGGDTATETIDTDTLAGFISIGEDLSVSISEAAVETYAGQMYDLHSGSDYKGSFTTTGGSTLGYSVTYYGQKVNKSALTDDIYKCVTEQTSGTRSAPYNAKSSKPYGGSYVEVDLSSQKLWLYKNGERIVSTSLVSGSVAEGCRTPTGVYSIYAKQTDRYLTGEDYRSFVHYWMPFLGGYGLHDASWRSSFGGTIYYYDGSHGCVNLPSSAAKKIYNNVSVGTRVILYGGKSEVPDLEQKLTGTTTYTVTEGAQPFKLDVKAKYSDATLSYSSSDTSVVTVSSNGTVTIKGVGTATITVKAAAFDFYTGAELKVKITVERGETHPTEPSQPTEPSNPTEPTEPKPTEPQPTEPKPTEPQPTEPKPTEPQPTEPKPTEPEPTEPQPTEPKPTEPAPTEPAPTEPQPSEP